MRDTLLLVTNNPCAVTLQEHLAPYYSVLQAADFSQAQQLLPQNGAIAAVVADAAFVPPLCALCAIDFPGLPVVALAEAPGSEISLLELGVSEILTAPFSAPLLLHRLRGVIALSRQDARIRPQGGLDAHQTQQQVREGLRLSLERHQIIMAQTNDIIFELDFITDTLSCSPKWEERFSYPHVVHHACSHLLSSSHIHPKDLPELGRKLEQFRSGAHYLEMEARIANAAGQYTWSRLRATSQQDQHGNTIKLIGVIIDIDQEKRISQALLDEAARDPLTKLYNRKASRSKIDAYLADRKPSEQAALLVIDLDNFKDVNDRYGHMFGDAVLSQASAEISSFFRGNDIISRIGGDEFLILMKNIPGPALVEARCRDLIAAVQRLHHEESTGPLLSCSVGVALVPKHGTTYPDLFQRADRALYSAKTSNKGCFMFYDLENSTPFPRSTPVVKDSPALPPVFTTGATLIRHVFDRFSESNDVESTIQSVLELAGRQVNASRAYIFENDPENRYCTNTFEWCNVGISPQIQNLQRVTYGADLLNYHDHFNERGIFYCTDVATLPEPQRDILLSQNIKSLLQCSIRDGGVFRGFVGFDECLDNRLWTQEQIDLLALLSQMLSLFLLKKRAQDLAAKEHTAPQAPQ